MFYWWTLCSVRPQSTEELANNRDEGRKSMTVVSVWHRYLDILSLITAVSHSLWLLCVPGSEAAGESVRIAEQPQRKGVCLCSNPPIASGDWCNEWMEPYTQDATYRMELDKLQSQLEERSTKVQEQRALLEAMYRQQVHLWLLMCSWYFWVVKLLFW